LAKCAARLGQTAAVIAIGLSVVDQVFRGEDLGQVWHLVPHRLCLLEVWTPFHRTFGARGEALRSAATARLTGAARVKKLFVWPGTAAAGDVLDGFIQSVDPPSCGHGAVLVRNPLGVAKVGRTIRAQHSAGGHHPGHLILPGLDLLLRDK
jgi:hypothetical protein